MHGITPSWAQWTVYISQTIKSNETGHLFHGSSLARLSCFDHMVPLSIFYTWCELSMPSDLNKQTNKYAESQSKAKCLICEAKISQQFKLWTILPLDKTEMMEEEMWGGNTPLFLVMLPTIVALFTKHCIGKLHSGLFITSEQWLQADLTEQPSVLVVDKTPVFLSSSSYTLCTYFLSK